jgi:hypothetical protein
LRQYKDIEKTPVNIVRRGENWCWFGDISKEIIGMFYTADWCVCVINIKSCRVFAFALV